MDEESAAEALIKLAGPQEVEREYVGRCYLQPPRKTGQELKEAVAALLDMARAPALKMKVARSELDLVEMGVECRRRGTDMVVSWDADFKSERLLVLPVSLMAFYRERAAAAGSSSEVMTEVIRITKYVGEVEFAYEFVSQLELALLAIRGSQHPGVQLGPPVVCLFSTSGSE